MPQRDATLVARLRAAGRPIAVDIVGRGLNADAEILAYAYDFEQATRLRRPPPKV
jgi:Asp-tRNA(Asn)/Glu-tRNA(Gln) amidotransferase A subunit family amidase